MLSNTCKYAIRAVVYIAINEEKGKNLGIKQIAEDLNIPAPFLGKILQSIAKSKILTSAKGPHGGFSFLRPPDKVTLADIVHVIDGLDVFKECLVGLEICRNSEDGQEECPFHQKSGPVQEKLLDLFATQTIGELARDIKQEEHFMHL